MLSAIPPNRCIILLLLSLSIRGIKHNLWFFRVEEKFIKPHSSNCWSICAILLFGTVEGFIWYGNQFYLKSSTEAFSFSLQESYSDRPWRELAESRLLGKKFLIDSAGLRSGLQADFVSQVIFPWIFGVTAYHLSGWSLGVSCTSL